MRVHLNPKSSDPSHPKASTAGRTRASSGASSRRGELRGTGSVIKCAGNFVYPNLFLTCGHWTGFSAPGAQLSITSRVDDTSHADAPSPRIQSPEQPQLYTSYHLKIVTSCPFGDPRKSGFGMSTVETLGFTRRARALRDGLVLEMSSGFNLEPVVPDKARASFWAIGRA